MRLDDQQESGNVEDRRGSGGMRVGGKGIGLGTIALALVAMYFGVDPALVMNIGQGMQQTETVEAQPIPQNDPMAIFVAKVLGSTEETWGKVFQNSGHQYPAPKLVLFSGQTRLGRQLARIDFGADGADNPYNERVRALELKHGKNLGSQVVRQ